MQLYNTIKGIKKNGEGLYKYVKDAAFLYTQSTKFSQLQFLDKADFLKNTLPEIIDDNYLEINKVEFLCRIITTCLHSQYGIDMVLESQSIQKFLKTLDSKNKLTLIASIEDENVKRKIMSFIFPEKNNGKIILKKNPFVEKKKSSFFENSFSPQGMQVNKIVEYYLLANKIKELKYDEMESSLDSFLRDNKIPIDHKIKFLADLFDQELEDERVFTLIKTFRLFLSSDQESYKNKYKANFIKEILKNEDFSYNFERIFEDLFFDTKIQTNQKETTFAEIERHKTETTNYTITQRF